MIDPVHFEQVFPDGAYATGPVEPIMAYDKENWPDAVEWMVDHVVRLHRTFAPRVPRLRAAIRL